MIKRYNLTLANMTTPQPSQEVHLAAFDNGNHNKEVMKPIT
jgi:hypothetical protein